VRPTTGATNLLDGYRFWLETRYKSRISTVTAVNYHSQAKQWVKWCEENDLDYRTATVEDMAIHLGELRRTRRQHTVRNRLICMRIFNDYLVFKGVRPDNPARDLDNPRAQSRPAEEFTESECRRMYEACKDWRERAIFLLFLGGGLRLREVFGVKQADCNFEQNTVTVLGKGSQYRMIAPGPLAMTALERAFEFGERLCPWAWPNSIDDLLKRLGAEAGVHGRVHAHRFRHNFASRYIEGGGSIDELAMLLGHSRIDMSAYYAKASQKRRALHRQATIDVASKLLSGKTASLLRSTG